MKKTMLVTFLVSTLNGAYAQTNTLQTSFHWKLYNINKDAALRYSIDTLRTFHNTEFPGDSITWYLKAFKAIVQNTGYAWMGGYYATCEVNQKTRKIDISKYGGFLYDEQDKQYYELPLHLRDQWMNYLNRTFHSISKTGK